MVEDETLVFVYGTLRKGGVRALPMLAPNSADLGNARTNGTLYDLGAFPGFVLDGDTEVVGELYRVDSETLARLDDIEKYFPDDLESSYYLRVPMTARQGAHEIECWTYVIRPERFELGPIVVSGDWMGYFATKTDVPEERWPDGNKIGK